MRNWSILVTHGMGSVVGVDGGGDVVMIAACGIALASASMQPKRNVFVNIVIPCMLVLWIGREV